MGFTSSQLLHGGSRLLLARIGCSVGPGIRGDSRAGRRCSMIHSSDQLAGGEQYSAGNGRCNSLRNCGQVTTFRPGNPSSARTFCWSTTERISGGWSQPCQQQDLEDPGDLSR
jgi:hypothetical protein